MDQIVRDARMIRVRKGLLLQNARRLEQSREGRIVSRRGEQQGQGIQHMRLGIIGIARDELFHRLGEILDAGVPRALADQRTQRGDIGRLPLGLRAEFVGLVQQGIRRAQAGLRRCQEGVVERGQRHAPIGHRAAWIAAQGRRERRGRGVVGEGVLIHHRLVERSLCLG